MDIFRTGVNTLECAVLMHLSKTFESVNHDPLIAELNAYDLQHNTSQFISSYFVNYTEQKLTQYVVLGKS